MKIAPTLARATADLPATTAVAKPAASTAAAAPTAALPQKHIEDAFGEMPGWKKAAVVVAGVAGLSVGALIGEQIGMGIIANMLPNLTMTTYAAIPLASMLGASLVGTAVGIAPFFKGTELT